MDSRELRIGNLINYEQTTHVIHSINKKVLRSYWLKDKSDRKKIYYHPIVEIKPIPLTEEWLLKFGFEKIDNHRFKIKPSKEYDYYYTISVHDLAFRFYLNDTIIFINSVFEVHQLQNLYFALTNEELIIKD